MTAFFDKQGRLVLALVVLLGLFYFVAYALNSKPKFPPEDVVSAYLSALKEGNIKAAYALLSEEDKEYFDIDRFQMFLRRQPQLQFLYGGSEINRAMLLREQMQFAQVETKDEQTSKRGSEILMSVTLPDIVGVLGPDLLQYYLYGEENQSLTTEQSLALSRRLESRLRVLPNAAKRSSYQKFILIQRKGQWQLSVPEWRVEAMVYEAKQKLIAQETEEAALILEEASNLILQVDDITRKIFIGEAIAGKHMLRYLPLVRISNFHLEQQVGTCRFPILLELSNRGNRDVRSVDMAVQFLDTTGKEVIADQVISFGKTSLGKQAPQTTHFLAEAETVTVKGCLTPPRDWSGAANSHIAWLTFAQTAD
jgi:hypothetical protein